MPAFRILALLLAAATIAFVAGCGGDDDEEPVATETAAEEPAGGGQPVEMNEYEFIPNDITTSAGDSITAENTGQIPHNFTIAEGEDPEQAGAELAATEDIQPGESGELTVDVEPGQYSIICTIPGHAEQGMVGTIEVE
jgi:plastocyanin